MKKSLLQRAKSLFVRKLTVREPDGWVSSMHMSDAGEVVNAHSALNLSTYWACVNLLAGTVGSLPCVVYRTNSMGQREVARDHYLYRLLHDSPNYDQTAIEFWEFLSASLEMHGNAYCRKIMGANGRLASLVPVVPEHVTTRRLPDGRIEYRFVHEGRSFVETEERMFHIRGFGGSPLGGLSPLQYGRQTFGLARAIDRAAGATFNNGLRPSGTLRFKEWLTEEQRKIAETGLVQAYAGAANAGRPLVLEGDVQWQQLTINPDDAQMLESRAFSVEEICRFFGVPPFMVGHSEKSSSYPTSLEQQLLAFRQFALRRRLARIEQAAIKQLLVEQERSAGMIVEFNLDGLLRGDSASRSALYKSGIETGWLTINEARQKENLPPVEGGDIPRTQMQNVPLTQTALQQIPSNGDPQP